MYQYGFFNPPMRSPAPGSRGCASPSVGPYAGRGSGSPFNRDRFVSPSRNAPLSENCPQDFDFSGRKLPGTPTTPRPIHRVLPIICERTLEAPDVFDEFPTQLLAINESDCMAVALGESVYLWREGDVAELLNIDVNIDSVCWVGALLAVSSGGHTELWDVRHEKSAEICDGDIGRAGAIAAYGGRFAVGGSDGVVRVYDHRCGLTSAIPAHRREVSALAWSRDGVSLASGGADRVVSIWGGRKKLRIEADAAISGLAWLPSAVLLAAQRNNAGTLGLFHTRTEDDNRLAETGAPISGVCWSEQWGVIVGHDSDAGAWELWSNDLARRTAEYRGHSQGIVNIAANPRGDMVATISLDRTLRVWELTMPARAPSPMVNRTPSPSRRSGSGRSTPVTFLR